MNMNVSDSPDQPATRWKGWGKWWIVSGGALLAVLLLYSAFWVIVAGRVMEQLNLWAEQQSQAGYVVVWDSAEITGYPFQVIATLEAPRVDEALHDGERQWTWTGPPLTLSGRPWNWRELHLDAAGDHRLTISETSNHVAQVLRLRAVTLGGDVSFEGNQWRSLMVSGSDIQIERAGRLVAEMSRFSSALEHNPVSFTGDVDERVRTGIIQFSFSDLTVHGLGAQLVRVAGSVFRHASLSVEIYEPLPNDMGASSLAVWRDAGGVAEVRQVQMEYGPLSLDAEGTVALDASLQPVGSFVTRIAGFSETVDALYGAGMIPEGDVLTIKLVLGVLAKKDPATGKSHLSIPLNIQDRTVYAGPLSIAKLPIIQW